METAFSTGEIEDGYFRCQTIIFIVVVFMVGAHSSSLGSGLGNRLLCNLLPFYSRSGGLFVCPTDHCVTCMFANAPLVCVFFFYQNF